MPQITVKISVLADTKLRDKIRKKGDMGKIISKLIEENL